jgi:hypothetical protein
VCPARNLLGRFAVGETSAALAGLEFLLDDNPGRCSRTRFALGYHLSGFQPCESVFIRGQKLFCPVRAM